MILSFLYQILFFPLLLLGIPKWYFKMCRRGGKGSGLSERFGRYSSFKEVKLGAIMMNAVSVGEVNLALKLIRRWKEEDTQQEFVLLVTTSTGKKVAQDASLPGVEVIYAPFDIPFVVRRCLVRYQPQQFLLIESDFWPNTLRVVAGKKIPITVVNARLSPTSFQRYRKYPAVREMFFSHLDHVLVQDSLGAEQWLELGVSKDQIHITGSIKFDQPFSAHPSPSSEVALICEQLRKKAPIVLLASSHGEEEKWFYEALHEEGYSLLIVPRHAERGDEIMKELVSSSIWQRSKGPYSGEDHVLLDSTGELSEWTQMVDVTMIGKSILSKGGQNPCEAIHAEIPVIVGPHMENFQPLIQELIAAGGVIEISDQSQLRFQLKQVLESSERLEQQTRIALEVLKKHQGATLKTIQFLQQS